jgi:hypothetical protein
LACSAGEDVRVDLRGSSFEGPIFLSRYFPACISEFPGSRVDIDLLISRQLSSEGGYNGDRSQSLYFL